MKKPLTILAAAAAAAIVGGLATTSGAETWGHAHELTLTATSTPKMAKHLLRR